MMSVFSSNPWPSLSFELNGIANTSNSQSPTALTAAFTTGNWEYLSFPVAMSHISEQIPQASEHFSQTCLQSGQVSSHVSNISIQAIQSFEHFVMASIFITPFMQSAIHFSQSTIHFLQASTQD